MISNNQGNRITNPCEDQSQKKGKTLYRNTTLPVIVTIEMEKMAK